MFIPAMLSVDQGYKKKEGSTGEAKGPAVWGHLKGAPRIRTGCRYLEQTRSAGR